MRRETETAYRAFDTPLVLEMRDAGLLVRRAHRRINDVLDTGLARERRETLALHFLPLDASFP